MILILRWKGEGIFLQVDWRPLIMPVAVRIFQRHERISYRRGALFGDSTASKISISSLSLDGQLNSDEVELIVQEGPEEVETRNTYL